MAIVAGSTRIMDPRKLPMEEMLTTAQALGNALLDKNDEGVAIICESLVNRYMDKHFEWAFSCTHNNLGHGMAIHCTRSRGERDPVRYNYHTPLYKLEYYRTLDHMGAVLLREIIYMMEKANLEMEHHIFYKDYKAFRLLEGATFLELCEEEWEDE